MPPCMRTTPPLEDDVAADPGALRRESGAALKGTVNEASPAELAVLSQRQPEKRAAFHTETASLGEAHLPNVDDVSEVLAFAEAERRP
jgi:hypothetical protein